MRALAFTLALIPAMAAADELPLEKGRFPGAVIEFDLTPAQKRTIDHYRSCQLEHWKKMNVYTPYVFKLTSEQFAKVRARVGYAPSYFSVYETVRGFNDSGPHWNLVLRYTEDRIEVPVSLLLRDSAARKARAELGWKMNNPCFPTVHE